LGRSSFGDLHDIRVQESPDGRYEDFRNLPDDELIRRIDEAAPNVALGVSFYFDELDRRRNEATAVRGERLVRLTVWLTRPTPWWRSLLRSQPSPPSLAERKIFRTTATRR
jgi:hypothetical protein